MSEPNLLVILALPAWPGGAACGLPPVLAEASPRLLQLFDPLRRLRAWVRAVVSCSGPECQAGI